MKNFRWNLFWKAIGITILGTMIACLIIGLAAIVFYFLEGWAIFGFVVTLYFGIIVAIIYQNLCEEEKNL